MRNNSWMGTLAALTILGITTAAHAQAPTAPAGAPAPGGKQGAKRPNPQATMLKELNLTPEQKTKVKTITDKAKADRKAVREDAALTPDQKKAKNKDIGTDSSKAIRDVLTPEQQTKFDELTAKMKQKGKKGAPAPAAPAKP